MDEDTERAYWDVERAFLEKFGDDEFPSDSQYRIVFKHLIPKIRRSAEKDCLHAVAYDARLQEAEEIVDDLAFALSLFWREQKEGWIWYKPTLDNLMSRPDTWDEASPVLASKLDSATARYLRRSWMQLNLLDWYILNGYIFDEAARFSDGMKSGIAIGITNWAHIYSDGDLFKTFLWRAAFQTLKFVARWIFVPAIVIAVLYAGYPEAAKWTAIPYGIYLIIHVALFPRRYLRRKALWRKHKEFESKLNSLIAIYQSSSPDIFNPSRLRDFIARMESTDPFLSPAVHSILDRAIDRDPAVFAIEGRG